MLLLREDETTVLKTKRRTRMLHDVVRARELALLDVPPVIQLCATSRPRSYLAQCRARDSVRRGARKTFR